MREILKSAEEAIANRNANSELFLRGQGDDNGSFFSGGERAGERENPRPASRASINSTASSTRLRTRDIYAARELETEVRLQMAMECVRDLEIDLKLLGMGDLAGSNGNSAALQMEVSCSSIHTDSPAPLC